ncbi:hypothetical protein [Rubrivirga sp. IMCC45206]|uniref:hypothetical protein n=1 Tax=Rubrivirga sp. IMCC45206 TaxID=3391614 RepID=UPI00398FCB6B
MLLTLVITPFASAQHRVTVEQVLEQERRWGDVLAAIRSGRITTLERGRDPWLDQPGPGIRVVRPTSPLRTTGAFFDILEVRWESRGLDLDATIDLICPDQPALALETAVPNTGYAKVHPNYRAIEPPPPPDDIFPYVTSWDPLVPDCRIRAAVTGQPDVSGSNTSA